MYIAARKRRYRRLSNGAAAHSYSATIPIFFDRLEFLQQQINARQLPESLDIVLVTNDKYLSVALTHYLFKHQRTQVCTALEEVESFIKQSPLPRVLIDLDCANDPILPMLDTIRQWQRTYPYLNMTLLTACRCVQTANLIRASSSFPVIERRQGVSELFRLLVQKQPQREGVFRAELSRITQFSDREWSILLGAAKGDSLKTIAASLKKPYHYVIYTVGKLNARIGLDNNKTLIHLLNKLSHAGSEKQ